MKSKSSGFTLIELVVVITILGILAAIALPRFAALQADARIAKMNGALASIKSGAVLAHSLQLTAGAAANTSVTMEGSTITMVNGYPTAADIGTAAGLAADYQVAVNAGVATITPDTDHGSCSITYTQSAAANTPPTYANANLTTANCQ